MSFRKLLVLIPFAMLLVPLNSLMAQNEFFFGAGYNVSYWPLRGLNNVINHYESYRDPTKVPQDNLEEETSNYVGNINLLGGVSAAGGVSLSPDMNLEFKYLRRNHSGWSSRVVTTSNESFERRIEVRTNSYGFGASKFLGGGRQDYIFGGTLNMTQFNLDWSEANMTRKDAVSQMMIGFTAFMKFIYKIKPGGHWGLAFIPYSQVHLNSVDFGEFNQLINPNSYQLLDPNDAIGSSLNFGIELQLNYFVFDQYYRGE